MRAVMWVVSVAAWALLLALLAISARRLLW
jgi:hypothetical protein